MTATARLDLRMSAQDKDAITRAAKSHGMSVATFVRQAALREAERIAVERASSPALAQRLRGRTTAGLSTDEIMQLTRGA